MKIFEVGGCVRDELLGRFEVKGSNRLNMELCQAFRDYMDRDWETIQIFS